MTTDTIEVRGPDGLWRDLLTGQPVGAPVLLRQPMLEDFGEILRSHHEQMFEEAVRRHATCNR